MNYTEGNLQQQNILSTSSLSLSKQTINLGHHDKTYVMSVERAYLQIRVCVTALGDSTLLQMSLNNVGRKSLHYVVTYGLCEYVQYGTLLHFEYS